MKLNEKLLLDVVGGTFAEEEAEVELLRRKAELNIAYVKRSSTLAAKGIFKMGASIILLSLLAVGAYLATQKTYHHLQKKGVIGETCLDSFF